jgi:hypothetical protein
MVDNTGHEFLSAGIRKAHPRVMINDLVVARAM